MFFKLLFQWFVSVAVFILAILMISVIIIDIPTDIALGMIFVFFIIATCVQIFRFLYIKFKSPLIKTGSNLNSITTSDNKDHLSYKISDPDYIRIRNKMIVKKTTSLVAFSFALYILLGPTYWTLQGLKDFETILLTIMLLWPMFLFIAIPAIALLKLAHQSNKEAKKYRDEMKKFEDKISSELKVIIPEKK